MQLDNRRFYFATIIQTSSITQRTIHCATKNYGILHGDKLNSADQQTTGFRQKKIAKQIPTYNYDPY